MKVLRLQIENVKKLKVVEITPDGNVVHIVGQNEQGKSTAIESIWMALGGAKHLPSEPIRQGEATASIRVELGENEPALIVTRKFTKDGSYLKVTNAAGAVIKSPQTMLDKLLGALSFNPFAFATSTPKQQVETLLAVVNLNLDEQHLNRIAGTTIRSGGDPIETLNNAHKEVFDQRTAINRQLDVAKKTLSTITVSAPMDSISISALLAEKDRLENTNRENAEQRQNAAFLNSEVKQKKCEIEQTRQGITKTFDTGPGPGPAGPSSVHRHPGGGYRPRSPAHPDRSTRHHKPRHIHAPYGLTQGRQGSSTPREGISLYSAP